MNAMTQALKTSTDTQTIMALADAYAQNYEHGECRPLGVHGDQNAGQQRLGRHADSAGRLGA